MTNASTRPDRARPIARSFARLNAAALRSLYRREVAEAHGVRAVPVGSALALVTSSLDPDFNRVVNVGVARPASTAMLDEIARLYARENVPFSVPLSPIARPPELARWLEERGLRRADEWIVLARDASPVPDVSAAPRIERIGSEEASAYALVHSVAFGIPFAQRGLAATTVGQRGWSHYVAYDGAEAIAVAAMYADDRAALFAGSATIRSRRGQGAQTSLVARRIADAAKLGCGLLLAETAEDVGDDPGPLTALVRAGFTVELRLPTYVYDRGHRRRLDLATGRWT